MDENILGKNIQHMRKHYGESLEELGFSIGMARTSVKDYESGRRKPNPDILKMISEHYGKTVDEMLKVKLYELEKIDSTQIVDTEQMFDSFLDILPLVESEKAYENVSFSKGMLMIKGMLNAFRKGQDVEGTVIGDVMDCFIEAVDADVYEAVANTLWCVFFLWNQQYTDLKALQKFQSRLISKQVDWKELIYETQKNEKKSVDKKKDFIEDFDSIVIELIRTLKEMEQWMHLGDYYLALRYVLGMVNTGCSNEMNQAVGMQMMQSFAQIGNRYASNYLKIDVDEK